MKQELQYVHDRVAMALGELESLFNRPMELTFIARDVNNDDCSVVVTSESDPEGLMRVVKARMNQVNGKAIH